MIFGSSLIVSIIPFFSRIIHHLANIETKMSPFFILKGEKDDLITNIDGKVPSSNLNHKLVHKLHLINDNVIQLPVLDSVMNIVKHSVWISQFLVHAVFKVYADDVVISHLII